jgi:Zn-finger nucleic acid-binding protein
MECPSCNEVLRRIEYEGMPVCTCPGCNGEFLDGKRLKYIERKKEIVFDRAERNRLLHVKTGPEKEKRLTCPRCGGVMAKGRYRKTEVIIDHCGSCRGVWLDDMELEKIQALGEAGKTGGSDRPSLAAAVVGARAAAVSEPGESTDGQGFAASAPGKEESVSIPGPWARATMAGPLIVILVAWLSGFIQGILPIERIFAKTTLDSVDTYLPATLTLAAAMFALTFRRITIRPGIGLRVKRYVLGIPWTREYKREEIKCIGTDFSRSLVSGVGLLYFLIDLWLFSRSWMYWRIASQDSTISGTSHLYVVLKTGKRILMYSGGNAKKLASLADTLQSGLKLRIRRL